MKYLIIFAALYLTGCAAVAEFFTGDDVDKVGQGVGLLATVLGMVGGPPGLAAGGALTTMFSVGKNYYQNKQHKGKIALAEEAFHTVVEGVEKVKADLPEEHLTELRKKLNDHTPEHIKSLIKEIKPLLEKEKYQ